MAIDVTKEFPFAHLNDLLRLLTHRNLRGCFTESWASSHLLLIGKLSLWLHWLLLLLAALHNVVEAFSSLCSLLSLRIYFMLEILLKIALKELCLLFLLFRESKFSIVWWVLNFCFAIFVKEFWEERFKLLLTHFICLLGCQGDVSSSSVCDVKLFSFLVVESPLVWTLKSPFIFRVRWVLFMALSNRPLPSLRTIDAEQCLLSAH